MLESKKTVLFLVNKQTTILNFRLEVVEALVKHGYRVLVSVPGGDRLSEIEAVGAEVIITPFNKDGTNPMKDLLLFRQYRRLIKQTHADILLTYTIKPNIYGALASVGRIPCVANITGLGSALEGKGIIQKITLLLYKVAFKKVSKVFFQNSENKAFFEKHRIAIGKHDLIPGSGVNLQKFSVLEYPPEDTINFAFISRIREEKGIEQYIDTARVIRQSHPNTCFHVCGFGNEYYEKRMIDLHNEGVIVYHGLLDDVRVIQKDVHCVIHPTFYPEGMSNVLLESAACARPIISTNRAGCREIIDDGINGYIVKERDSQDLINKVSKFLLLPNKEKRQMGINGRKKVECQFDRNIVVRRYCETVDELTQNVIK